MDNINDLREQAVGIQANKREWSAPKVWQLEIVVTQSGITDIHETNTGTGPFNSG